MLFRAVLILVILLAFESAGLARSNIREICRSSLGGRLLEQISAQKHDTNTLSSLNRSLRGLENAQSKLLHERGEAEDAVRKDPVNIEARDLFQIKKDQLSRLEQEITQLKQLKIKTQENHQRLSKTIADFRKDLLPIFVINTDKQEEVTADIVLTYRDPCPKFLIVCPLPDKTAKLLSKLLPQNELPDACKKYVQQKIPNTL